MSLFDDGQVVRAGTERDAWREKATDLAADLDEATQLLVLLTPILRAWEHDSLFHNDLIGERERCEFCILVKRIAAFLKREKP